MWVLIWWRINNAWINLNKNRKFVTMFICAITLKTLFFFSLFLPLACSHYSFAVGIEKKELEWTSKPIDGKINNSWWMSAGFGSIEWDEIKWRRRRKEYTMIVCICVDWVAICEMICDARERDGVVCSVLMASMSMCTWMRGAADVDDDEEFI